jgi:GDP-L-fucose synthase
MISFNSKIYVAGHKGLVGSAIIRKLADKGYKKIITAGRKKLDLTNQSKVFSFIKKHKPKFIFIAAAKVGGIYSNNKYKAEFIQENLSIQNNLIHSAYLSGVKNLIFLGSSCVYPRDCKQPIKEKYLLSGPLESTNDAYAIAKIAGIKMCQSYNEQYKTNYKCLMPTNTYGPNDNYHPLNSHFLPSLIRKVDLIKRKKSKYLYLWGNGKAKRELIYVDDLAEACLYFMNKKTKHHLINIGTGKDHQINYIAKQILKTLIPERKIIIKFDKSKPNGTPRKVLDISLAKKYRWKAKSNFKNSILETYKSFKLK